MNETKIEWCTKSLNPVVGCTFNCVYCYAKKLNHRFNYIEDWNKPRFYPERLKQLSMKKPQNIFMNSMSDIADWEEDWIDEIAVWIDMNPQHNYLFLTKRIDVIEFQSLKFLNLLRNENVWIGVTINTNRDMRNRLPLLSQLSGIYRCHTFLSIEPIQEYIVSYNYYGIDWIIVGAETGNRKDKIIPQNRWTDNLENVNCFSGMPLFYKESMKAIVGENNMFREFPKELRSNKNVQQIK